MTRNRGISTLGVAVLGIGLLGACTDPTGPDETSTPSATDTASQSPTASATTSPAETETAPPTSAATSPTQPSASSTPTTAIAQTDVAVRLTYAGATNTTVEAAGFAEVTSPGTCTLKVSGSSGSATASGQTYEDATTTSCGTLSVPRADVGEGPWRVQLGFENERYLGWSEEMEISR